MHSLYLSPRRYSQHCFFAINSAPKEEGSILACFLLHQWTNEQYKYTSIPVLYLLVTLSEAWSASTLETIVNPIHLGSGMLLFFITLHMSEFTGCPIPSLKVLFIYRGVTWVKYEFSIMVLLQIPKYLHHLFHISLPWQC